MNNSHEHYLKHALELAKIRRGFCAPNPSVGCVVVKNDEIFADGYHNAAGQPHAEVNALTKVGDEAEGAIVYVSLEPCCHWGKTPPCTDVLIKRKVSKVIYGFADPNPEVAGKSFDVLRKAGIESKQIKLPEIDEFYQSYTYWQRYKRPFVTAKLAVSFDGKIAGSNGQPVSITGPECQVFTHEKRKQADAILTTASTIKQDDPQLNVRLGDERHAKPIYVLDSQLSLPIDARILDTAQRVTLFHSPEVSQVKIKRYQKHGVTCIAVSQEVQGLSLEEILTIIGKDGIHDLWIETGGQCFQAFVKAKLVQHAYIYLAAKTLGSDAHTAFTAQQDVVITKILYCY